MSNKGFGCIYLITCLINNKKYIGQHYRQEPSHRWKEHLSSAKNGSPYLIHNAIRLYGENNFKIEVLCMCPLDSLGRLEEYFAEQHGSYIWDPEPGYNMVWCGEHFWRGMKHTEDTRKIMREKKLALPQEELQALGNRLQTPEARERALEARLTPEVRAKQSLAASNPSDETRKKKSDAAKNMSSEARARQIEGGKKPEAMAKKIAALTDPVTVAKRKAAQNTPEYSEKQRQGNLNRPAAQRAEFADIGRNPTEETRKRMREAKLGKKQTPEQIEKKRLSMLAVWKNRRAAKEASRKSLNSATTSSPEAL